MTAEANQQHKRFLELQPNRRNGSNATAAWRLSVTMYAVSGRSPPLQRQVSRRGLMRWGATGAAGLATAGPWSLLAPQNGEDLVPFLDYTREFRTETQEGNPHLKCFDLRRLTSLATPSEEFFEYHQTETIHVEARRWRLRI